MGSGYGSVGRADASDFRGLQFESDHQRNYIKRLVPTVLKRQKLRKRYLELPILKR